MTEPLAFPTQGELVTYTFNAFGVLPVKHDRAFEEKAKTSFQRLLKRLKDEEGLLIKNFEKALETFNERLGRYLQDERSQKIIMGVLADLYHAFNRTMINEGTYTTKKDTLLYFLVTKATSSLVESATFRSLRWRLFAGEDLVPNLEMFLPDISEDGKTIWPLAKVIRWIYSEMNCSQTQFHFPGKVAGATDYSMDQNLENAGNWARDEALPSLPALITNFQHSLEAQKNKREIPAGLQSSMVLRLTLARLATAVCKDISDTYGIKALKRFTTNILMFFTDICLEIDEFKRVTVEAHHVDDPTQIPDPIWEHACADYSNFFFDKKEKALETLHKLYRGDPEFPFKSSVIAKLTDDMGRYPVRTNLYIFVNSGAWQPAPAFYEYLERGLELKKNSRTTLEDVSQFENDLAATTVADQLAWLVPWLKGVIWYRANKFEQAWPFSKEAFTLGKYRAGGNQYLLVNQFLELSAKTRHWREFKAAYEWANYAGIKVRWAGDNQVTQESMESAYAMLGMQNLSYSQV